ncbi:MAG: hypothetical protein ACXVBR_10015 [Flavisolibacter sp.]
MAKLLMLHRHCFLFVCVCLLACQASRDRLPRIWLGEETASDGGGLFRNPEGFREAEDLTGANFVDLQPNGTYTSYLSSFESGKWYLKDQNLLLVNSHKQIREWRVDRLNAGEMTCTDKIRKLIYHFRGESNEFSQPGEDPFSLANNQWRFPPNHPEGEAALRARLKNHFRFWEKYFAWGYRNNIDQLDLGETPSLLKIYGNGFQLEYYENLLPEWKHCFYDSSECRMAYEDLYYKMYAKNIRWPNTKNRFERFVSAFGQLQQWMDEKMSPYVRRPDATR